MFIGMSCEIPQPLTLAGFLVFLAFGIYLFAFLATELPERSKFYAVSIFLSFTIPFFLIWPSAETFNWPLAILWYLTVSILSAFILTSWFAKDRKNPEGGGEIRGRYIDSLVVLLVNAGITLAILSFTVSPACFFSGLSGV